MAFANSRQIAIGAEVVREGGVHFRVWAPKHTRAAVVLSASAELGNNEATLELVREQAGYFSGQVPGAAAGMHYQFRLGDSARLFPDPASRFQPRGPHGPSEIVDASRFEWSDRGWPGVKARGNVIYEMHIGTFTQEGTWRAAAEWLPELAELGINVIELLPVADFVGEFGWGYDGVNWFAPTRLYGRPDDFRHFVDRAHQLGIGVILDVVYNHFGPDGDYLPEFSDDYGTETYQCEWGRAVNFDGQNCGPVREFVLENAAYWICEYHLDGLRIDATQQIFDSSEEPIVAAIARVAREAGSPRSIYVIGENEPQQARLVRPREEGGYGLDALWNDDFHHSGMVALAGRAEAYYSDYRGRPQEFISMAKWGFLYQGQLYSWQKKRRGTPSLRLAPSKFVNYLQNHDQVANSGGGERAHLLTSPGRCRAMTAVLLLSPQTPMIFQGQEFAASTPFLYFADHREGIAQYVARGRKTFLSQFRTLAAPEVQAGLAAPGDRATFARSKLKQEERSIHKEQYALFRDLLRMRRDEPAFRRQEVGAVDGEVLGPDAFVLRFFGDQDADDRLLVVNLGRDLDLNPAPHPLLAPPEGCVWELAWSSEDSRYGGWGTPPMEDEQNWHIQGETAAVLRPISQFVAVNV
jgi:maltooligosyltrehalose trehalohydrolase